MWILQWLTSGALWPTLLLPILFKWWHTIVSIDLCFPNLWFNKNYNNWCDYAILASLQGGHSKKSIMGFYMFGGEVSILPCLYYQRSHTTSHCGIKECLNQLWRNARPSWFDFLGFHTIGIIFRLKSKDHDRKPESFPFQHTWIWNSLFKFFGVTFIFFLCLIFFTLVCDIK
jgi:hypothetical protein